MRIFVYDGIFRSEMTVLLPEGFDKKILLKLSIGIDPTDIVFNMEDYSPKLHNDRDMNVQGAIHFSGGYMTLKAINKDKQFTIRVFYDTDIPF